MDNKFFTFIKPYLSFIDKGDFFRKPFSWLYIAFAVLNLILPFYILYTAIDNNIFDTPANAKFIIVFILVWIVIAFASWVCFQLWWDRKNKVTETSVENSEFVVTPVFAHFIQTFGEWIGTWIGIVGFFVALLDTLGSDAVYLTEAAIGVPFIQSGIASIILMPIYGFLIVVGSRFLAEMCRALASIANNTKKN